MRFTHATSLALYKAAFKLRWRDGFFSRNYFLLLTIAGVMLEFGPFPCFSLDCDVGAPAL